MKICLLLHGGWSNPHAGAARPMIGWARGLERHDASIALLKGGSRMQEHIDSLGIEHRNYSSIEEMANHLKSEKPDVLVGDDNLPVLKAAAAVKKRTGVPVSTYAQLLLGTQSIVDPIDSSETSAFKRVRHGLSRLVPFSAFRSAYRNLLGKDNAVICNSRSTATLLQVLYGVEPEGVVYPPVDQGVFFPRKRSGKNGALLYLGSFGLDSDPAFLRRIIQALQKNNEKVTVFGNRKLGANLAAGYGVRFLDRCTDDELAAEYSASAITICPQKWELFGYVVAESICCGTPVLAYDCMGPGEILSRHGGGVLVNRREEFLSFLDDVEGAAASAPAIRLDGALFEMKRSASALGNVLERSCARGKCAAKEEKEVA
jgi:glycosyltransferase involved in cell wall biosynthesis